MKANLNLRESAPGLIWAAAVVIVVMGGVAMANVVRGIPIIVLTSDPAVIAKAPFYVGAVTMIRTALLAGAAAVCLVAARVLRVPNEQLGEFLTALGWFSVVFVIDDLFQVHEHVLDEILGVPQPLTLLVYVLAALVGVIRYGRLVLDLQEAVLLLFAFPCFVLAVAADTLSGPLFTPLVETTAELSGIICLAVFGFRVSLSALRVAARGGRPTQVGVFSTLDPSSASDRRS